MKIIDFDFDPDLLNCFLDFPRHLYASDPNWIADPGETRLLSDSGSLLPIRRNFLAVDGNKICGRVTAMINSRLCDGEGRPYGQLGFFECVNDLSTAQILIDQAAGWLGAQLPHGSTTLAPMNFDTWHPYRLRTKGFDEPTFFMEPYNPPYYPALFITLGFSPVSHYVTKTVTNLSPLLEAWQANHERIISQGYRVRAFDLHSPASEMSLIYRLALAMFRENLFFSNIPETEFRALYAGAVGIIDPDLFLFVIDSAGEPVGLSFSIADHRLSNTVNVKTFGVLPHIRGAGVGAALAYEVYQRFQAKGLLRVNHCLMRAGNRADAFDGGLGEVTREYTLYSRML